MSKLPKEKTMFGQWKLRVVCCILVGLSSFAQPAKSQSPLQQVPRQPLLAHVHRLVEAMEVVGSPIDPQTTDELRSLKNVSDESQVLREVQRLLDPHCLAVVDVQVSGAPKVVAGEAATELLEQGWRTFLVKVINRPGHTGRLLIESPNARPLPHALASEVESRWMQISSFDGQPMRPGLSGLALEYRIVQIYSRDVGEKNATIEFTVSQTDGDAKELFREWRFDEDTDGWHAMNQCEIESENGSLHVTSTGDDPFMGAEVEGRGGPLILRFWARSEEGGIGQLFWWTKDIPNPTGDRQTNFVVHKDKDHLYEVPFHVDGTLAGVRLDPLVRPGKIRIDWIYLYAATRSENWSKLDVEFRCVGGTPVTLHVADADGKPCFAKFEIKDSKGRLYPAQSKRLAPDFFFQRHIYRGDGEILRLPPDDYTIICSRGPETIPEIKQLTVGHDPVDLTYRVNRWIDPSKRGWWSGDHHIHAAGCLHYENPTQGVKPDDMIRHIMGEDLKVGCCLTWGPCFDYQKRFFTGEVAEQSRYPYTLRYDVEVSGFGSHNSGHLNLLNLTQQIYPGGESKDHWPTLGLNTLRWAKRQGAVCGPAHSSAGLTRSVGRLPGTDGKDGPGGVPNFNIPAFDGIGANEFIVDVTHRVPGPDGELIPAVDFISTMNTDRVAELNMWYHVLNSGFRVSASGETDFPCMSGERVGIGRVYAHVEGELTFEKWVRSIGDGRSYVSDGSCHLLDFRATSGNGSQRVRVGEDESEMDVTAGDRIRFSATVSARLPGQPDVPVELIVNGYPEQEKRIRADGSISEVVFDVDVDRSQWVAIRVFPNAHTNPIYLVCNGKPVRGNLDSMRWCLAGVEQCWKSKQPTYAADEQPDAKAAYEHARSVYQKLISEAKSQ